MGARDPRRLDPFSLFLTPPIADRSPLPTDPSWAGREKNIFSGFFRRFSPDFFVSHVQSPLHHPSPTGPKWTGRNMSDTFVAVGAGDGRGGTRTEAPEGSWRRQAAQKPLWSTSKFFGSQWAGHRGPPKHFSLADFFSLGTGPAREMMIWGGGQRARNRNERLRKPSQTWKQSKERADQMVT